MFSIDEGRRRWFPLFMGPFIDEEYVCILPCSMVDEGLKLCVPIQWSIRQLKWVTAVLWRREFGPGGGQRKLYL